MTFTNGDVNIPDAVLDVAAVPPVVADACAHGVARHAVEGECKSIGGSDDHGRYVK
jgi:hypothetical protein